LIEFQSDIRIAENIRDANCFFTRKIKNVSESGRDAPHACDPDSIFVRRGGRSRAAQTHKATKAPARPARDGSGFAAGFPASADLAPEVSSHSRLRHSTGKV